MRHRWRTRHADVGTQWRGHGEEVGTGWGRRTRHADVGTWWEKAEWDTVGKDRTQVGVEGKTESGQSGGGNSGHENETGMTGSCRGEIPRRDAAGR